MKHGASPVRPYDEVAALPFEGGFAVALDGRIARTPGRAALAAPTLALAEAVASEWRAQGARIDFNSMPVTRLLAAAIDGGEVAAARWREEIVSYLQCDLLSYRAASPRTLRVRQDETWNPIVEWARDSLGLMLVVSEGVAPIVQPTDITTTGSRLLSSACAFSSVALRSATALTGSAVLALALWRARLDASAAIQASRIDEDFQIERWGADAEASARAASIEREFNGAAVLLRSLGKK